MKTVFFKKTLLTAALLTGAGYAATASAHDLIGKSLGKAPKSTDTYTVTCFTDGAGPTYKLEVRVRDRTPAVASLISIQALKTDNNGKPIASNATDVNKGDNNYSRLAVVIPNPTNPSGGNGVYTIFVDKTKVGVKFYDIQFHCKSQSGDHTGTSTPTVGQNQ